VFLYTASAKSLVTHYRRDIAKAVSQAAPNRNNCC